MPTDIETKLDTLATDLGLADLPTTQPRATPMAQPRTWTVVQTRFHDGRTVTDLYEGNRRLAVDVSPDDAAIMAAAPDLVAVVRAAIDAGLPPDLLNLARKALARTAIR